MGTFIKGFNIFGGEEIFVVEQDGAGTGHRDTVNLAVEVRGCTDQDVTEIGFYKLTCGAG